MKKRVNPSEVHLQNILAAFESQTFSRDESARIVGGLKKLTDLISEGKIEAEKNPGAKNCKWRCNARQVLMHCKDFRPKSDKVKPNIKLPA